MAIAITGLIFLIDTLPKSLANVRPYLVIIGPGPRPPIDEPGASSGRRSCRACSEPDLVEGEKNKTPSCALTATPAPSLRFLYLLDLLDRHPHQHDRAGVALATSR